MLDSVVFPTVDKTTRVDDMPATNAGEVGWLAHDPFPEPFRAASSDTDIMVFAKEYMRATGKTPSMK
jgi:hypothetical protein